MALKTASLNLINIKYLFDLGMSGAHVKGELLRLLDPIKSSHWNVPAGTLAVLLDKGERYYIVALRLGMFGFAPFKTDPALWESTGEQFEGGTEEFEKRNDISTGQVDMTALAPAADFLKTQENCSGVFQSERSITAVFDEEPQGPDGYRSRYQIRLQALAGLVAVTTIIEGQTKTIKVDPEQLMMAVQAAVVYLNSRGDPNKVSSSSYLTKTASKSIDKTHVVQISDVDRYITDLNDIYVSLRTTKTGFSVSCQALLSQVGVSSCTMYWSYRPDEAEIAQNTHAAICKVADQAKGKFEFERLPIALLSPFLYSSLQDIDLKHREKSGVQNFNYAVLNPRETDWRSTIYSNHYPDLNLENQSQNIKFNLDDRSRKWSAKGKRSRDQVYSYHYAESEQELQPLVKYGSFILTAEQQRNLRQRFLGFTLGLSPSLVGAFMLWLAQQRQILPRQVDVLIQENPVQIQQLADEFKEQNFVEQNQPQFIQDEPTQSSPVNVASPPKERTLFDKVLKTTLGFEGGYSNHPKDPGGETYKGITRRVYLQYLKQNGLPTNVVNMKEIPENHVRDIYLNHFWKPIKGDQLPPHVAQQLFDYAVNSGRTRAIKSLQIAVGARPDGQFGQNTLKAVNNFVRKNGDETLAQKLLNERSKFLATLSKKHPAFAKGWGNRIEQLRTLLPSAVKNLPAIASAIWQYHFGQNKSVPIVPGAPKERSKNVPPRWTYDFFSPQVWALKEPDSKDMPLDPDAYAYEGSPHRLLQHQVIVNTPYGRIPQPQDAKNIEDLYRGVHATQSFDLAAVYANNRATAQDPPVVIEFTTQQRFQPDVDALNYEMEGITERIKEIEGLEAAIKRWETTKKPNWRYLKSVFKEVESMSYDDNFESPEEIDWDASDYIADRAKRLLPADVAEFFKTHYPEDDEKQKMFKFYVPRYLRAFYEQYLRPLFLGGEWDNRLLSFMQNSMRFMDPINEEEILAIHQVERFNPTPYNPWEPPDSEDEEEPEDEEGPWYDRRDEEGREMIPDDSLYDSTWSPTSSILWESPKRPTNKDPVYYHGTSLSRAKQALSGVLEPHQAAVYQLIGKYGWHWGKVATALRKATNSQLSNFNKEFLVMHSHKSR